MNRALAAALVLAAFAGGVVAGGALQVHPDRPASQGDRPATSSAAPAPRASNPGRARAGAEPASKPPPAHEGASREGGPAHGPRGADAETTPRPRPPLALDAALAAIAAEDDSGGDRGTAFADTIARLREDPAALAQAIARFRSETDPARLSALALVLGLVRDPAVEAIAMDLARAGDREHRLAALEILDAFETLAAIPVASEILAREDDPALLRAALHALPEPAGVAADVAAVVDRELVRLARDAADPETRRRAVERLGAWAFSPEDEVAIVDALGRDPDPGVRAAAAFALGGRRGGPAVVRALAEALARRDEDRDVRENAWQALRRAGPLPPEARAAYEAYAAEREGSDP
jgi:hypothetical protein